MREHGVLRRVLLVYDECIHRLGSNGNGKGGIVGWHEYDALGEDFEAKEKQLFASDGFEKFVAPVDDLERTLGIEDLSRFTPQ